jgi:protein SCO1
VSGQPAGTSTRVWAAVGAACAIAIAMPLWMWLREVEPPPVLGEVAPYAVVDQDGQPAGRADLNGHITVAAFIFTRCQNVCPTLTARMVTLDQTLPDSAGGLPIRLISLTVDPQHDTPEVLRTYAKERGVSLRRWRFLTGSNEAAATAMESFLQAAEAIDTDKDGVPDDFTHSQRVVLVDPGGRLRGVYETEAAGLAALKDDISALGEDWRAEPVP